jgi:hypothetical protein
MEASFFCGGIQLYQMIMYPDRKKMQTFLFNKVFGEDRFGKSDETCVILRSTVFVAAEIRLLTVRVLSLQFWMFRPFSKTFVFPAGPHPWKRAAAPAVFPV